MPIRGESLTVPSFLEKTHTFQKKIIRKVKEKASDTKQESSILDSFDDSDSPLLSSIGYTL
uniref:Uncharacterized protein n=1 Tax=Megaselia scalaris TaxID=36166 RepID=T1GYX6_MEGSC